MWVQSLGQEDSPGAGNGNPLQYSCLDDFMDRGVWCGTIHGAAASQTEQLRTKEVVSSSPAQAPLPHTSGARA